MIFKVGDIIYCPMTKCTYQILKTETSTGLATLTNGHYIYHEQWISQPGRFKLASNDQIAKFIAEKLLNG